MGKAKTMGTVSMNELIMTQLMTRIQKRRDAIKYCIT